MAKFYDVIQASSLPALIEEVNKRLEQGWELHEGSTLTAAGWSQAMTTGKKPEAPKPGEPAKDLTDAEAHAEFLERANSAENQRQMNQITGPTPVVPGINEPMVVTVQAAPVAEAKAAEAAKVKK